MPFNPTRLLLEVLLIVASAEISVMLVLPVLAPNLGALSEGLLDVTMLMLMAGPAVFWRIASASRSDWTQASPVHTAAVNSSMAVALTAFTQIVGLLLTAGGVWWQGNNLEAIGKSRFEQGAERTETEVARRLNQSLIELKGIRGAIAANPHFKRQEFRAFVESRDIATEFSGIRGFGMIQSIQRKDLQRFVAEQRADGAPDFVVHTSGVAANLFVIKYLEPLASNQSALGYDLGQDANRRAAVEYALATGQETLLAGIELMQDDKRSPGLLFFLPVYQQDRNVLGLVYAPIVAAELLGSVAAATDRLIDFELFDGSEADPKKLIFDADGILAPKTSEDDGAKGIARKFVVDKVVNVGSRVLTLRMSSTARFEAAQDRTSLIIIGFGGTLVSFFMAISVWLLAMGRQRARQLADSMTTELDRMAQVVQHTDNAVTIMDRDMRIQWVNKGFTQITGYTFEEAQGKTPGELLSSGKSDAQAVQTLLGGANRGVACRVQLINRAKNGTEYWADTEVQPMLDKQGQLIGFMEIGTDITRQKETQHQLEAAMRAARALLNTVEMHAIVSTTNANGILIDVNDAFCQTTGYTREELLGKSHRIVNSDTHSKEFWANLWQTIGSGKPWHGEICNRAKNGALLWFDSMIAPFVGDDGKIEKYIAMRTDITERHLSAEKLRRSEATFAASFQDAASGMAFLSPKGQWLRCNPAMCEFLGYSDDALHELTVMDLTHPDEWDTDSQQMQRLLDGEITVYQRAKRYVHRDGQMIWGLASISVVRAGDGEPEFVIAQIVDITARKRAEEALSLSNALMEETQAVARVGGWEVNLVSHDMYWTSETYSILETTPEEFAPTAEGSMDFYLPGSRERMRAGLRSAIKGGQGFDLELEMRTIHGRVLTVRTTCSATLEHGKVVRLSGILQDITERTQYERSLREAREKAELATQTKGQFLANMSHEIRTPMNAILGMLKLLHNTELNSRQRDYAAKTESAAKSLLGLINDILDFSKVEAGKMQLDPQAFRLETLMRDLAVILSSYAGATAVEVLYDIDPTMPEVLLGDSMRLQQVLINLGGNAVKFTSQGQVVIGLRLKHLRGDLADIEFSVQDSGIGIAPENQDHIFTGFSQAEASTTRKFGGTGLGLAISQRLVDLMGGALQLESVLGEGSTFYFTLQLPVVTQVPPELQVPPPVAIAPRRALVVGHNAVARGLLSKMLQSIGWSTTLAASGEAALELLAADLHGGALPFDVIYMGWQMSGMDGWETTARLRQLCAKQGCGQPVVVMVSASNREALDQRTQEEQNLLNGFLVKPVTAAMLRDAALEISAVGAGLRSLQRSGASQRQLNGMRILVVEDNLINQQVAEELLTAEGALVSLAANGRLGVEAIAAAALGQQFDVVLMDIQMPVLDGFAATRMVREELRFDKLPIVAMTANALHSDREEALAAGMNEHVGKPFDLKALVQTLIRITGFTAQIPVTVAHAQAIDSISASVDALPIDATLNANAALARMGGLTSLYLRSAQEFMRALPGQLEQLRTLLPTDSANCAMVAHTLKGTAATLGAMTLSEAASRLEAQCKDAAAVSGRQVVLLTVEGAAQSALQQLQKLMEIWATKPINAALGQSVNPRAAPPLNGSALHEVLAELEQLLDANDLKALETFADQRSVFDAIPPALLDVLEGALQGLDLTTAALACRNIDAWLQDSIGAGGQLVLG